VENQFDLPFALPTLKGERVDLRPINPEDYPTLFQWHSQMGNLAMWWADRQLVSYEEFVDDFQRRLGSLIQVILIVEVAGQECHTPVGMAYSYNTNLIDRYTHLCVYLSPEHTAHGIGPEAGVLFVDYLFSYFGFRKVYAEIFGYNQPSIKAALSNGFAEEGRLSDHRWFGNRYWDLHILSISRQKFEHLYAKSPRSRLNETQ
jgi:RimJ/RimL family protein N-acetyltransferase